MKRTYKAIIMLGLMALLSILVVACGGEAVTGPNQVHMNDTDFLEQSITIKKGEEITLVNDAIAVHVVGNGTWDENNTALPATEDGAPAVDASIGGYGNQQFGPFNTAGTFEIYCLTHPGMNLTVIVE